MNSAQMAERCRELARGHASLAWYAEEHRLDARDRDENALTHRLQQHALLALADRLSGSADARCGRLVLSNEQRCGIFEILIEVPNAAMFVRRIASYLEHFDLDGHAHPRHDATHRFKLEL